MVNKYVRTRTYEVVDEFSMGHVDVVAVWQFEVKKGNIDVTVTLGMGPTPQATLVSGDERHVDIEDVPYTVLRELDDAVDSDRQVLRSETEREL
jgi:hypothetical protein